MQNTRDLRDKHLHVDWYSPVWLIQRGLINSLFDVRHYARGRLLDVGCGSKPYESIFADHVVRHIGFDLLPILSANKRDKSVDVWADLGQSLPFVDESFDTILLTEVLEHVSEPQVVISELKRLLRERGYLILTAPQTWGLHEEPNDYYRYTKYGLRYLLEANDLHIVYLQPRGGIGTMVGQRLSAFLHYTYAAGKCGWAGIIARLITRPFCLILQYLGYGVDLLVHCQGDTLGYTVVACKGMRQE